MKYYSADIKNSFFYQDGYVIIYVTIYVKMLLYRLKAMVKEDSFVDDNEIVELYLSRNEDAINQTAIKYGTKLKEIAYHIVNDRETAKECENDAYFETWERIPLHEPRTYLFAFVGRIVRNIAINVCRKNNRQKRYALFCELTQEMKECLPAKNNIDTEIEAGYISTLIDDFLETCSEEQQKVFIRRYWYFDPISQISKTYGFSQSKVKTMLFRMRSALKNHLEKGGVHV